MTAKCHAKHTAFQCKDTAWFCPKCGATPEAKSGGFIIEEPDATSHIECCLLHNNDECLCHECGYAASGKQVARILMAKALMAKPDTCTCPTCGGKGTISKAKAQQLKEPGTQQEPTHA